MGANFHARFAVNTAFTYSHFTVFNGDYTERTNLLTETATLALFRVDFHVRLLSVIMGQGLSAHMYIFLSAMPSFSQVEEYFGSPES